MKSSIINKISALFLVLVFLYTNCNYFTFPEIEPSIHTVPVGLGKVGAVFLDEEYKPTTTDIGIVGLFVEDNKYAEGVMVIAEIPDNHIDNNVTVRVINNNNNSLVTFFYNSGFYFPAKMVMTLDGQTITGQFSNYNILNQSYSVKFIDEDEEEEIVKDLILNRNVFSLHEKTDELSETQNERLQKIYTTLGLWTSLALQLEDFDDDNNAARAINLKINVKKLVVGVLVTTAVVATTVAIIATGPASIAVVGPALVVGLTAGAPAVLGAIGVVSAGAAILCDLFIPDDLYIEIGGNDHKTSPPNEYRRPKISITYYDDLNNKYVEIPNDQEPPFYLEQGESITFYFSIEDMGSESSYDDIFNLTSIDNILIPFDPNYLEYIGNTEANARFFDKTVDTKFGVLQHIKITRNTRGGSYGEGDTIGRFKYLLFLKCNVIINGKSIGVEFDDNYHDKTLWQNLFIFNFTVIEP